MTKGFDSTIWKCSDGREIAIGNMDTRHIRNAIAKIKRSTSRWRIEFLMRLQLELEAREADQLDRVGVDRLHHAANMGASAWVGRVVEQPNDDPVWRVRNLSRSLDSYDIMLDEEQDFALSPEPERLPTERVMAILILDGQANHRRISVSLCGSDRHFIVGDYVSFDPVQFRRNNR